MYKPSTLSVEIGVDMAVERESINFKLPKTLTAALRAKAHSLNTTATDLVIQGLHHVLGLESHSVDSRKQDLLHDIISRLEALEENGIDSVESRLHQLETQFNYLESRLDSRGESGVDFIPRLSNLEEKLEAIQTRIAQMEGAISMLAQRQQISPARRQAFTYHPPQLELKPYNEENLAKRLAVSAATIHNERSSKSPKEFESWCRQRDPGGMGWRYEKDGFYHPVK